MRRPGSAPAGSDLGAGTLIGVRRAVAIAALAAGIAFYAGVGHHISSPEELGGAALAVCVVVFAVAAALRVEPVPATQTVARHNIAGTSAVTPAVAHIVGPRASPAWLQRFLS